MHDRPNIVFILTDDMGYGDVSCLNKNSKIPTPHIDHLAQAGRIFTDAHAASSICSPSRYSILTGQYSFRSSLQRGVLLGYSKHLIDPQRLTVPALLQAQGYHTAFFGKWHLGMDMRTTDGAIADDASGRVRSLAYKPDIDWQASIENGPNALGFDEFFGISASLDHHPYIYIHNDSFVGECTAEKSFSTSGYDKGPAEPDFEAIDVMPRITSEAIAYIEQQDDPFFVLMSTSGPHLPILPTPEFQGKTTIGAYGDFCVQVDDAVGQVMSALERKGIADNTIVVFTSDNGCAPYIGVPAMIEKGHYPSYIFRGYKHDIWEGGHRIPFILRWPDRVEAGSVSDEIICLTDLLATCAALTGADLPVNAGEDSYNIMPAILGEALAHPIREATVHQADDGSLSIRQSRWKLEMCAGSGGRSSPTQTEAQEMNLPDVQLYDLQKDIAETTNVREDHPYVVRQLSALLERYKHQGRSVKR